MTKKSNSIDFFCFSIYTDNVNFKDEIERMKKNENKKTSSNRNDSNTM